MHLADRGGMQWSRLVGSVWVCCGLMFVVIGLCWVRFGFSVSGSLGVMRCYVPYVFGSGYLRMVGFVSAVWFAFSHFGSSAHSSLFLARHVSMQLMRVPRNLVVEV